MMVRTTSAKISEAKAVGSGPAEAVSGSSEVHVDEFS